MNLITLAATLIIACSFSTNTLAACNIVNGKAYGDCAGVSVNKGTKGKLTISSHVYESGIIEGGRIVSGGRLHLSGISNGDITVGNGGTLIVTGIVNGTVRNNGGSVEIEGQASTVVAVSGKTTIAGIVSHVSGGSKVKYKSGAVIGGVPRP